MLSVKITRNSARNEVLSFTYPKLYTGVCWFVAFYAIDPAIGALRRKRIKINSVGCANEKKRFATQMCHKLSAKLESGWNPWIDANPDQGYKTFSAAISHYQNYIEKQLSDGSLRQSTIHGYTSSMRIMVRWNDTQAVPINYIYQFDRSFCVNFLDYIYVGRGNSPTTRNNNLAFLRSFSTFLIQHAYIKVRPTDGLQNLTKGTKQKERTVISPVDMQRLKDWLVDHNQPFLLACYFLHYMLIRPREMAKLRLNNINIAKQTIFISEEISKNKKASSVTIPVSIIELMIDLGYFNSPGDHYIFSDNFKPGIKAPSERTFRNFWNTHVVPALKFPTSYQFYSLKDTGITSMLRSGCDPLSVKEQARHSSLAMTDIYTPQDIRNANPALMNYRGIL